MKSAKQNIIRQSIDGHRITLIESNNDSLLILFTSTKQRTRRADDGYKKNGPREASPLLTKLDPSSLINVYTL